MDAGFANKVVLVTGGSGGIGQEVVRLFAEEGAKVAIQFFRGKSNAETLLNEIGSESHCVVGADLRNEAEVLRMFSEVESRLGTVDILIANAGYWPPEEKLLSEMTLEQWKSTIDVDITSVFLSVRQFLKKSREAKLDSPSIVMVGSTAGFFGEAGHGDYAAAKSGVMGGLLASLKNEIPKVAARGRVNVVCPGWTLTPMAEKFSENSDAMVRALQTIPLRKFAAPRDIANAIAFLASNRLAGHITGECLFVSGGMEGRVLYAPDEIDLESAKPK